ncbi:hypothetical protein MMC11_008656 [Xylographa trunciseda]|nr:hypothetical protein [Xylographa trunciseda]
MDADSPVTQSPKTPRKTNKAYKTKAPAYTPEQRAFIKAASLEVATVNAVQERYNEKFPENKKESWEIKAERTKLLKGKKLLEVKVEAAANLELGTGTPLRPFVQRRIKMQEARDRHRTKMKEIDARANGLYVPKTPPRVNECLEDSNDNLEAIIRELDMDSEDDFERVEGAVKTERDEKHDKMEMSSDHGLK